MVKQGTGVDNDASKLVKLTIQARFSIRRWYIVAFDAPSMSLQQRYRYTEHAVRKPESRQHLAEANYTWEAKIQWTQGSNKKITIARQPNVPTPGTQVEMPTFHLSIM